MPYPSSLASRADQEVKLSPFRGCLIPPVSPRMRNHRSSKSNTWDSNLDFSFGSQLLAEPSPNPAVSREVSVCRLSQMLLSLLPWD